MRVRNARNSYNILIEKPVRKRPLGRRKWEDNIKMNLTEIGCEGVGWNHLVQDMVW
jgi:hypothetical protein